MCGGGRAEYLVELVLIRSSFAPHLLLVSPKSDHTPAITVTMLRTCRCSRATDAQLFITLAAGGRRGRSARRTMSVSPSQPPGSSWSVLSGQQVMDLSLEDLVSVVWTIVRKQRDVKVMATAASSKFALLSLRLPYLCPFLGCC